MSDAINGRRGVDRRVRQARLAGHQVGVAVPALAELLGGVEASDTRDRNRPVVERAVRLYKRWPFFEDAAREYARLYGLLRRGGRTVPPIDLQIAAIARTLGDCTVVTVDGDFSAIPGLKVENWAT
ncbi:MAG: type II toxin-antitoxin system VapC family toxin [Gemmataceae bacterium]|nr:type II toxin-antitoxin system VapC family toxin [Gemmataceae bacterium]